jgi:hypothetical protein
VIAALLADEPGLLDSDARAARDELARRRQNEAKREAAERQAILNSLRPSTEPWRQAKPDHGRRSLPISTR